MKIATRRIICREAHTGFHIRINARQQESRGHYIIQGRRDSRHELRVRIAGEGWSPSVTGGQEGMVSYGQREQGVFDVVAVADSVWERMNIFTLSRENACDGSVNEQTGY
ncbi:AfaD family invasin [Escherichia coli]